MTTLSIGEIWLLMIASGIATFLIRASFIFAEGHYSAPHWLRQLMPFVPIAMLTALVLPDIALVEGSLALGVSNAKFWAGVTAVVVAARWRNILLTIASGFGALVLLRFVF